MDARSPDRAATFNVVALVHRLRLATGLVLFSYVLSHLLNHAMGGLSLSAMLAVQYWFVTIWQWPPMTALLFLAALIHVSLALWSIYRRRQLRMPPWEAAQLLFGLAIPPVMVDHVIGTRVAQELYGVHADYIYVLFTYATLPWRGVIQAVFLVTAWIHGCIGLNYWLRLKPWYRTGQPIALALAVLTPVLALVGFYGGLREVQFLAADPAWFERAIRTMNLPDAEGFGRLIALRDNLWVALAALLALTLAARLGRQLLERRRGLVRLNYPGGRLVTFAPGMTVLEASRCAGIPHASVCGGRGRCSTCRVRISLGGEHLPEPTAEEARVLKRVGASTNVRLACQIRPSRDLELTPLVPPTFTAGRAMRADDYHSGREAEIAVLFADLRGFTSLCEHRLPFDTVFLLNRYFAEMGRAIEDTGGHLDKFIGDGVMALFGLRDGPKWGAIGALTAAKRMHERLAQLNRDMASELSQPLRLGIGIHTGAVIVGDMGYGEATQLTAIGDVVNTASRLESLTKEHACELVISAETAHHAALALDALPRTTIMIRGRDTPMEIGIVKEVAVLDFNEDRRIKVRDRATRRAEAAAAAAAAR
ncbi:MAG: adenylate/guanylate cyclase domain-containing protein [Proteobacteria bacterium]|nr:adenylate/guanylate cyclase domain-containing protein [Pseudomonadota bacterium]